MAWPVHDYGTGSLPGMAQQMWGQAKRREEKIKDRSWNTGLEAIKSGKATDPQIADMAKGNRQIYDSLVQMRDQGQAKAKADQEKDTAAMDSMLLTKQIQSITKYNFLAKMAQNYPNSGAPKSAAELASILTNSIVTEQMIMDKQLRQEKTSKQATDAVNAAQGSKDYKTFQNLSSIARAILNSNDVPKELRDYLTDELNKSTTRRDAEQNKLIWINDKTRDMQVPKGKADELIKAGTHILGKKEPEPTSDFGRYQKDPEGFKKYKEDTRAPSDSAGTAMKQNVQLLMAPPFSKSPQEALSFINASKNKSREQFVLEIYKNELNATGKQDKATVAMEEAGNIYDKVYGSQTKTDYGPSDQPEGTTATGKNGLKIVTKNGKWVVM